MNSTRHLSCWRGIAAATVLATWRSFATAGSGRGQVNQQVRAVDQAVEEREPGEGGVENLRSDHSDFRSFPRCFGTPAMDSHPNKGTYKPIYDPR